MSARYRRRSRAIGRVQEEGDPARSPTVTITFDRLDEDGLWEGRRRGGKTHAWPAASIQFRDVLRLRETFDLTDAPPRVVCVTLSRWYNQAWVGSTNVSCGPVPPTVTSGHGPQDALSKAIAAARGDYRPPEGAGVREPRRPRPSADAAAVSLPLP